MCEWERNKIKYEEVMERIVRVSLETAYCWKLKTENWKHCSKIIFKYVNSAWDRVLKKNLHKLMTCRYCEQCTRQKKKKKKKKNARHTNKRI